RVLKLLLRQPNGETKGVNPGWVLPCPGGEGGIGDLLQGGKAGCCRLDLRSSRRGGGGVGVCGEPSQGDKVLSERGNVSHCGYRPMNRYSATARRCAAECVPKV